MLTCPEVMQFLRDIESGKVKLTPSESPQKVYAGNVFYSADNGWEIIIFNDCNEWDYIDTIRSYDGRELDFEMFWDKDAWKELSEYGPSDEVIWERYRIPGYLHFRCEKCGKEIDQGMPEPRDYTCQPCGGKHPYPIPCPTCGRKWMNTSHEPPLYSAPVANPPPCDICVRDAELREMLAEHEDAKGN